MLKVRLILKNIKVRIIKIIKKEAMPNLQKVIENKLMKEIYKLQLFNKVIMVKNFLMRF